jgi:hypothetical protein
LIRVCHFMIETLFHRRRLGIERALAVDLIERVEHG